MTAETLAPAETDTQLISDNGEDSFPFEELFNEEELQRQLKDLYRQRMDLIHRKSVADRFSETARKKLEEIEEQITILQQFMGSEETNNLKEQHTFDEASNQRLDIQLQKLHIDQGLVLDAKQKEEQKEEEKEKEKEKQEKEAVLPPRLKAAQPQQPARPDEPQQQQGQQELTPEQRKELIRQKLSERDPRKQKQGLDELKKPENKDLGKDDPVFQKLQKNAEKRVEKFEKIRESLRKNLKTLMQSDSDVVKKNLAEIRAGRIGSGLAGMKEIGKSTDGRFNEVAGAAHGLFQNVAALYKEFDIKPEEALSRSALDEARPTFTRQMGFKSKADKEIDRNSNQNTYMGQSNELSEEERNAYKKIKEAYGVEVDKLPPVDAQTQRDMDIVRDIVRETAQNPNGKIKPTLIKSGGMSM